MSFEYMSYLQCPDNTDCVTPCLKLAGTSSDGSNYNIENFTDKDIDLRKLNSVYASVLFAYKKNVYLPIFNCKLQTCPLYSKCNSMYSDKKENE